MSRPYHSGVGFSQFLSEMLDLSTHSVGAVEGEIDPRRRVVPLVKVGNRRGRGGRPVRVDDASVSWGPGLSDRSANVDFLDGAVIGLVDRQHEAARVDLLPVLRMAGDGEDVARDGLEVSVR